MANVFAILAVMFGVVSAFLPIFVEVHRNKRLTAWGMVTTLSFVAAFAFGCAEKYKSNSDHEQERLQHEKDRSARDLQIQKLQYDLDSANHHVVDLTDRLADTNIHLTAVEGSLATADNALQVVRAQTTRLGQTVDSNGQVHKDDGKKIEDALTKTEIAVRSGHVDATVALLQRIEDVRKELKTHMTNAMPTDIAVALENRTNLHENISAAVERRLVYKNSTFDTYLNAVLGSFFKPVPAVALPSQPQATPSAPAAPPQPATVVPDAQADVITATAPPGG